MCGFCIWVNIDNKIDVDILEIASELFNHRGPDSKNSSYLVDDKILFNNDLRKSKDYSKISLGISHRRLSILDKSSKSNQPMVSQDNNYAFAYNGEVYNYLELKEKFKIQNIKSSGDSEVLFKLLIDNGYKILNEINGMWAFSFFDKINNKVILSRDRYGKKPLFFYHDNENFIASSEIKTIFKIINKERKINPEHLSYFLLNKRWPNNLDNSTFYKDIKTIEAGEILIFDIKKNTIHSKFLNQKSDNADLYDENILSKNLNSAVNLRLRADVKIGILISGGVDSTLIAGIAALKEKNKKNITFYTVKDINDDYEYSKLLAKKLGIKLKEISLKIENIKDFKNFTEKSAEHLELPINYNVACYPSYIVYKKISQDGVKVVLEGGGGDEIFSCYESDLKTIFINNLNNLKLINFIKYFKLFYRNHNYMFRFKMLIILFRNILFQRYIVDDPITLKRSRYNFLKKYLNKNYITFFKDVLKINIRSNIFSINNMHNYLIERGMLKNFLLINDRYSMMNSIEVRSPMLDFRLKKYINLPLDYKYKNKHNKYVIRKLMPLEIPKNIRWRTIKSGFAVGNSINFQKLFFKDMIFEIQSSKFLNNLLNLESLINNFSNDENNFIKYSNLIENLYSIAVLDKKYNLKI